MERVAGFCPCFPIKPTSREPRAETLGKNPSNLFRIYQ